MACQATAPPDASVPGLDARLPVASAAFAIGALVHALDYDDTHPVALVISRLRPRSHFSGMLKRMAADDS